MLYRTVKNAIKLLISSKKINESLLITVSVVGAFLVGQKMEGLMVITLYEIGKILESKAVNKTRKSISELMDIRPEYANVKITEKECKKVGAQGRMIPVPRSISAGCGLSWCAPLECREELKNVMQGIGLEEEEIHECMV